MLARSFFAIVVAFVGLNGVASQATSAERHSPERSRERTARHSC